MDFQEQVESLMENAGVVPTTVEARWVDKTLVLVIQTEDPDAEG